MWNERGANALMMEKAHPNSGGATRPIVQGHFAAFRSNLPGEPMGGCYEIVEDGQATRLWDVQWGDWDADGRLLDGSTNSCVLFEADLGSLKPSPPSPRRRRIGGRY